MGTNPTREPAWYPDPTGRFELRYYDGQMWTLDVQRDGVASKDLASAALVITAIPEAAPVDPTLAPGPPAPAPGPPTPGPPSPGPGTGSVPPPYRPGGFLPPRPPQVPPAGAPEMASPPGFNPAGFNPASATPGVVNPTAAPFAPSALGRTNPDGSPRGRAPVVVVRREVAPVGPGTFIGLAGVILMAVGALTDTGPFAQLRIFSGGIIIIAWYAFVVVCTTLRYQPRSVAGFFLLSFIGLILMRGEPDADSRRANAVAAVAILLNLAWSSISIGYGTSSRLLLAGQVTVLVAALVGRRVVKTEVYL